MENASLENQLFEWEDWDGDQECMTFSPAILKVPIGKFPVGTRFDSATILYTKSIIQFSNFEKEEKDGCCPVSYYAEYNLNLTVGNVIKE
jgi:hypothetical protein